MIKEIGSEFISIEHRRNEKKYFLSGRTALDYIIRDIKKTYAIKSVLLPSYCCNTMIDPFIKNGINVRFYDVIPDEEAGLRINLPKAKRYEIFYYMRYFGYMDLKGYSCEEIKSRWEIIIEDKTHSWLSMDQSVLSDYHYISYRKWTGLTGIAMAEKHGGGFQEECIGDTNEKYNWLRTQATAKKCQYFAGLEPRKEEYLTLFNEAEELLEKDYEGYRPLLKCLEELENLDTYFIKERRRKNAQILIKELKDISEIKFLFPDMGKGDVPLFVPILIRKKRDQLRDYLICHDIYCPVHWPLSELHEGISEEAKTIYGQELSLICDQRYGEEEMTRIVTLITRYFS